MKELLVKQLPAPKWRPSQWRTSVSSYKPAIFSTVLTVVEFLVPFLRLKTLLSAVKYKCTYVNFLLMDILF